ncbi:insulin receptor substrate 1 isoform X2 [Apis laboriosa]|uniref:insulin receptor substrate 1 isoform X2 n=1 Tax=Apis dorsata TaxID=7462 RepID=UPI0003DF5F60|nr:insulin receptor substrate 1 isoform X2 [Apis dorsata]XP_043787520.1 insulin receptor substrate 1 isoform X2 [Apis laboriosa]
MSSSRGLVSPSGGPVVLCGHVKKLKTQKKKYFVLRGEAPGYPACLEYYDSKKKFENRQPPKRSILLDSCFNINRRVDTKHKHVIALYTKDECFCLILESEKELDEWLKAMLLLQSGDVADGEQPRPIFEHVWQVTMQKKGLGERKNIHGPYRLCLTDRTLSLVKIGAKDNSDSIEFPLICIRRCGYMDRIFYMEVGRSAVTGGGELWMEAEDNNIAHNMHAAIMNSMSNSSSSKDDVGPRQRVRSSSATEASKPIFVLPHRYTGQRFYNSPLEEHRTHEEQVDPVQDQEQSNQTQSTSSCNTITGANGRDRCDSLPSRGRTTSESHPTSIISHPRSSHFVSHVMRPHSMYVKGVSYSPPISSMPISPASGACSTDSAGSSLSMDDGGENVLEEGTVSRYGHSLTPDEPVILEENGDDYAPWSTSHSHHKYSPNFKSHSPSQQSSYLEMCSPCGSSPGPSGAYMPMSSGTGHSHSRGSSLVEESNTLPEGYVPMAPVGNNGYVDMDPSHNHNGHFPDDLSHGGSSCSVTSGTPSTDLRFSEYHLDKVTSFLPPGDDLQARPARAYSIGSRPEPVKSHRKNRLDITQQDVSRVRAFSVGSRSKKPELGKLVNVVTAPLPVGCENSSSNKSNSAPLLSSSWGHNSGCSITSERMEDLMELDFTKPSISTTFNSPPSSYSQPQSQSHSFSTATDTSSYVDMSPGQPPSSTTAPYVDMSRINKINRNNNNNTITANQNHSHIHVSSSASIHKPVITTLKPVEEAEGPYMRMDGIMEDWSQSGSSPKLISSPMQEESVQSNGPPGATRTAPVDLPRRPPADYVDMNFKPRTSLEQDYINMNMSNRNNRKPMATRTGSRKEKSRSQPIAIQAGNKPIKTPSFLPLNGSPESESLASTPASPPRATPTGSSATIFPFSLNSPQSPEKSFTHQKNTDEPSELNMTLKHNNDRTIADATNGRVSTINSISVTDANSTLSKVIIKDRASSPTGKDNQVNRIISNNSLTSQDNTLNNVTKKFSDLNVSKPRLITASPNTSPTLSGFKPTIEKRPSSPKLPDETPTPTPTAMPSPLEKENFDKVQAAAEILHYASLDLPEVGNAAPMSPASQEGFNYAKIDFAKLKQN